MAETKAPAKTRAATPRKKATPVHDIIEEVKEDVEVAALEVKEKYEEVKAEVELGVSELEGKTVPELRVLHDDALIAVDQAQRMVHVLRQRAANAVVDVDTQAEEDVIAAKKELAKALQWLRQIENALEGEFKDLYGTKYGDRR